MGFLSGRTIAVTRPRNQQEPFAGLIRNAGGAVLASPLIAISPCFEKEALLKLVSGAEKFDWVCFTSANGVELAARAAEEEGILHHLKRARIACIGPATEKALLEKGIRARLIPEIYQAEGLLEVFQKDRVRGKTFLLLRAKGARPVLRETLAAQGGIVTEFAVYETVEDREGMRELGKALQNGSVDCVTFTSSSTVSAFARVVEENRILLKKGDLILASIGSITSGTLMEKGFWVDVEAKISTSGGLMDALEEFFKNGAEISGMV